jgi:acetyl-CoA carboxylase carboxyl transferase subunit beta
VDAVVDPEELRDIAINVLTVLCAPRDPAPAIPPLEDEPIVQVDTWESIERSRRPERPGVRALLRVAANTVTPLHGTGQGERDPGMLLALARFGAASCVVLAQDRRYADRPMGPAGLREARRGMRLAAELGLPLVTVVDTAGAALSKEAEEGGLAADRVLCAQHGWLSPLPPEGASAIRFGDTSHAAEMAAAQGVRSTDLLRHGIVDRVIAELPDAADEAEEFVTRVGRVLEHEVATLMARSVADLLPRRLERYRRLGT